MKKLSLNAVKVIALCVIAFCMAIAGFLFREHRTFKETVVVSEGCTEVKKLSDYSDAIKPGSVNDCNVYIYDSGVEGGTFLIIGGSHPEEPTGPMVAQLLAENLKVLTDAIVKAKPAAVKGQFLKSVTLATTMGPGVKLNPIKFQN